jgi:hypothetical protein
MYGDFTCGGGEQSVCVCRGSLGLVALRQIWVLVQNEAKQVSFMEGALAPRAPPWRHGGDAFLQQ